MNWLSVVSPIVERVLDFIPNPAEKAKAQMEAEEAAKKKERDERDVEANKVLMKARLVSYYRGE